jgi:hypothetical protein
VLGATKDQPTIFSLSSSSVLETSRTFGSNFVFILIFLFGIGGLSFLFLKDFKF